MARKSKTQRLNDSKTALALWVDNGLAEEAPAQFISQMISRIESGKYPSPRQREWLDNLAAQGVDAFPVIHNQSRLDEIDVAINTKAMHNTNTLTDFRYKLSKGWNLSEKQEAFLTSLLEQASELRENGLPPLSDEDKFIVESLLEHATQRTINHDYYGYRQSQGIFITEVKEFYKLHNTVTARHVQSLRKMFKGVTTSLSENKFPVGNLVSVLGRNGIVMSKARVNKDGVVVISVLASGKLKEVSYGDVRMRLLKNEVEYVRFWDDPEQS